LFDGVCHFFDAVAGDEAFFVGVFAPVADGDGRFAVLIDEKTGDVVGLQDEWKVVLDV
jgi:hypothetical protein